MACSLPLTSSGSCGNSDLTPIHDEGVAVHFEDWCSLHPWTYVQKGAEGWRFGIIVPESLSLSPSSATQQACWACGQETCFAVPVSQVEVEKIQTTVQGESMHTHVQCGERGRHT